VRIGLKRKVTAKWKSGKEPRLKQIILADNSGGETPATNRNALFPPRIAALIKAVFPIRADELTQRKTVSIK